MTRRWLLCLVCVVLTATADSVEAQVSVSMQASATDVRVDDRFQLQITVESESLQNPDVTLPPLDDFDVVQRQVSRPMSFSFSFGGKPQAVRSTTQYSFVLQPTREGRFVLPAVEVRAGGKVYRSQPLTITVRMGTAPQNGPVDHSAQPPTTSAAAPEGPIADSATIDDVAFVRAVADKPEAFVGEQVTVTFYLYLRGNVQVSPSVDTQPTTDGFWIHDLLGANAQQRGHRQMVRGVPFTAYTLRRFAAFPLREGELTIGPMAVTLDQSSVFDLFSGRAPTSLKRTGEPLKILVKPLPDAGKPPGEVAVGRFSVTAKLDRDQVATGDAVTLTATVQGSGNIRTVALATPVIDGLRILQPQVRDVVETPGDLAGGIRTYEWLVVPERPGTYAIGPLSLALFDPASRQYSSASSSSITLIAAGAAKANDAELVSAETTQEREHDTEPALSFAPIRTESKLARTTTAIIQSPAYQLAFVAPLLLWLSVLAGAAVRARVARLRGAPNAERDVRNARKLLALAESQSDPRTAFGLVSQALVDVLEARLGQVVRGLTQPELIALLSERGMPQSISAPLLSLLSECDQARFSPVGVSAAAMQQTLARARQCFDGVARFEPTEAAA